MAFLACAAMDVLEDPTYVVPQVPPADAGVAWLRAHVARFSEGVDHARRRTLAEEPLAGIDPATLRRPGAPVATLAAALGLPRTRALVADVRTVASAYQPHAPQSAAADEALARLVDVCGGTWDEPTAARIGLLVQACDATSALIAGREPPVPATRRIAPDGSEVVVDLTGRPFGAGRHRCPGEAHALALAEGARAFGRLHAGPDPLVLPNAWDLGSALALVAAGFPAIGTTSLGVAVSRGLPDAAGATRIQTVALAEELARLPVPVTVDIEFGFTDDLGELTDLAAELSAYGVAGVNIEDGRGHGLADPAEHAERVAAVKRGAPELFVNARTDTYWVGVAHDETTARVTRYVDAGADGVFVPGLTDPALIEELVARLGPVPLNVLAQRPVAELAALGVRRISTGSLLYRAAVERAVAVARAVGDSDPVDVGLGYREVMALTDPARPH